MMDTAFDFQALRWDLPFPERVSQYNVVYLTPPDDPLDGMALGNGRMGAIIWFEGSCVHWQLNRCDLFSEVPCETFHNWRPDEEERVTALRHAGRGRIDFRLPVFDPFYLEECRGDLDIAHGAARMRTRTPFGAAEVEMILDSDSDQLLFRCRTDLTAAAAPEFTLERYGSRTYSHWYGQVRRDPSLGLAETQSRFEGEQYGLTVQLGSREFAVGGTLAGVREFRRNGPYSLTGAWPEAMKQEFGGSAGCTAPVEGEAWQSLHRLKPDFDAARRRTAAGWEVFWSTFRMDYGDEYLNQLYHLALYYLNASQRGDFPGRFINGLWGWNRDVQNWNFYFHWNQQQLYWGVYAAGHPELARAYLQLRRRGMASAGKDAAAVFQVSGGLAVSDVTDKDGANSVAEFHNHTPGAQIALDFYRHYQYTGDLEFLREQAYPYMTGAARFLESRFAPGDDGKYHAREGTAYEGWIPLTDAISEISCLEALLDALLEAGTLLGEAPEEQRRRRELRSRLAAYPDAPVEDYTDAGGRLKYGNSRGAAVEGGRLLAAGFHADGAPGISLIPAREESRRETESTDEFLRRLLRGESPPEPYGGLAVNDGIFPWVELCPIFPAGTVGVAQRGSAVYAKAVNTLRLMTPATMGWGVAPVAAARLGLAEETARELREFPEFWQWFRNGFFHYGPLYGTYPETVLRGMERNIRDCDGAPEETFPARQQPFRHMGMESLGVLTAAVNEALLQCHDGVIRVFPACGHDAGFSLHAHHQIRVDAEKRDGEVLFVVVTGKPGRRAAVAGPWPETVIWPEGKQSCSEVLELDFSVCESFILLPAGASVADFAVRRPELRANDRPRYSFRRRAMLGLEKMF